MTATTESWGDEATGQLVVIGSSAGGIEALQTLIGSLPADFPAPIVIAQHLDPNRASQLPQILSSRTTLPVRSALNHEPLQPGVIYVVPSDRDVEITDHQLNVDSEASGISRPSIDRLLATAARVFGDRLIAVILTGLGTDGSAGAQAVKAYGGAVIIQNPETARFSGMPGSVPESAVDFVANLDDIGPLLTNLVSGAYALPRDEGNTDLGAFLERLRDRTGIDFNAYKRPTIERRLQRRMAAAGSSSLADYQRAIERHPDEMQRLVSSFLIKVTAFFRDPELFDYLRESILPELIERATERGELRIWSAGCSTGEEAYGLAMLVADLMGDDLDRIPVRIFATDIALDAVEFARRGVYPAAALEGLPPDLIERHFVHIDGVYEVKKAIRGLVVFGEHDLGYRAPFPRIDLVLCRNVLIYFTPELQRRALQLFAFALRQDGYLVLGQAESVSPLPEYFAIQQQRTKVFRRVGEAAPLLPGRVRDTLPLIPPVRRGSRAQSSRLAPSFTAPNPAISQMSQLFDDLTVGVITVNRGYDIRYINLAARQLLGIRSSAHGEDLVHLVDNALTVPLRSALDTALGGASATIEQRNPRDVVEGDGRDLQIACSPLQAENPVGAVSHVLVEIIDISGQTRRRNDLQAELNGSRGEQSALQQRTATAVAELRELRNANQSMALDQGRLHAENEQLQVSNEEAQAAAEEIETLNEELQATNEELETLNEELQATVEELTTTNDELYARTVELLDATTSLNSQRLTAESNQRRLASILSNMGDAVLVVDERGEAILTNDAYNQLFGASARFVPENPEGRALPEAEWPIRRVVRGESFMAPFTLPRPDGARQWIEANGQSIRGEGNERLGVIVFRNMTERSLRRMQEDFLVSAAHELRTPLTSLSGSLQLMRRRLGADPPGTRVMALLNAAIEQARRLDGYVGELVDVARLHGGKLHLERTPVDLAATVLSAADILQMTAPNPRLDVDAADEPVLVRGDHRRLEQIALNLIANAMKYAADSERIVIRVFSEGDQALLEVEDQGIGIAPDALPHLFDRFFQGGERLASRDGLGHGLYIVRELVAAHGGTIDIQSTLGEGSTFIVRLPLLAAAPTDHLPAADPGEREAQTPGREIPSYDA